jgi:7-carboxy-7-deazaguanine synthase
MKTLKVSEVFYSLQGEGFRAGHPSVFVRLSGCDLTCGFCDTEFESGVEMDLPQLGLEIGKAVHAATGRLLCDVGCGWIVWTGGEPTLQLDADTVAHFKGFGWSQAIETNGNRPVPPGLDWVACSPKVAEHVLAKSIPQGVDELRYVRHSGQPGVPMPSIPAKHYYLSPRSDGERINKENLNHCIKLCLENPKWKLSVQTHKLTVIL